MNNEKKWYRVASPIKDAGAIYQQGDKILLDDRRADVLRRAQVIGGQIEISKPIPVEETIRQAVKEPEEKSSSKKLFEKAVKKFLRTAKKSSDADLLN